MSDSNSKPTINIVQAVTLAGVSRRTIYNWIARGIVDYFQSPTGIRIWADSIPRRKPKS